MAEGTAYPSCGEQQLNGRRDRQHLDAVNVLGIRAKPCAVVRLARPYDADDTVIGRKGRRVDVVGVGCAVNVPVPVRRAHLACEQNAPEIAHARVARGKAEQVDGVPRVGRLAGRLLVAAS